MSVDLPNSATAQVETVPDTGKDLEALRDITFDLTDAQKLRYERAFEKAFEPKDLPNFTKEQLNVAKEKDPGIIRLLFTNEKAEPEFQSRNNENVEWHIGLRDLIDENVAEITLKIHPKNLEKGGNTVLLEKYEEARNALAAYKEDPSNVTYFTRKSLQRDGQGNFTNDDGYFRVFSGDTWVEESNQEKPTSLTEALDTYDTDLTAEMERNNLPDSLKGMLYALMWHESRWNHEAKNPNSSARGLGGMTRDTALTMQKFLLAEGRDIPADETEFLHKMETDGRLQIMALVKLARRMCERLKDLDPALDPIAHPSQLSFAFLAMAHHEGRRGIQAYVKWWQDQGRPETIPEFPDSQRAQQYMVADFQKARNLEGKEGTNGLISDSLELAEKAEQFNEQIAAAKRPTSSNT